MLHTVCVGSTRQGKRAPAQAPDEPDNVAHYVAEVRLTVCSGGIIGRLLLCLEEVQQSDEFAARNE